MKTRLIVHKNPQILCSFSLTNRIFEKEGTGRQKQTELFVFPRHRFLTRRKRKKRQERQINKIIVT